MKKSTASGAPYARHAASNRSFVESVGVNVHLYYTNTQYAQVETIKTKLTAANIRHYRDGAILYPGDFTNQDAVHALYRSMYSVGLMANLTIGPTAPGLDTVTTAKINEILTGYQGVNTFEGPNELDGFGGAGWPTTMASYMPALKAAIDASDSPKFLVGPSLTSKEAYQIVGDISNLIDASAVHLYQPGRNPEWQGTGVGWYGSQEWGISLGGITSPGKPTWITETGHTNAVGTAAAFAPTPEDVAGRYVPRIFLLNHAAGVPRTFYYELIDLLPDPNAGTATADIQSHFGLLRNDLTEKPAYTRLKALMNILYDASEPAALGTLAYGIAADPKKVMSLLFQDSSGAFYVCVWQPVSSYDPDMRESWTNPAIPATVNFAQTHATVTRHEVSAETATAQETWTNVSSVPIQLTDEVTVLKVA